MNTPLLLRRLVLLGAPLSLIVVGLTHPRLDGLSASLAQADVHFALHLALIPLFGLIGLAGSLLTIGLHRRAARISRGAMAVFVTLYAAYATLDGVTVGLLLHAARELPADQQAGMYQFLGTAFASPLSSAAQLAVALGGTLAWIVGMLAAVVALARARVTRAADPAHVGRIVPGRRSLDVPWLDRLWVFLPSRRVARIRAAAQRQQSVRNGIAAGTMRIRTLPCRSITRSPSRGTSTRTGRTGSMG